MVLALIDLSKAFNRVDHTLVIQDLHDMKVPAWLLRILISYLTERTMILKFRGASSSVRSLPGSSPQGVFLGCFFFMIKFNGALLRPSVPRPLPLPSPIMKSKATTCTVKYIDDATQACAIKLRDALLPDDVVRPRPLNYRERTGHILNPLHNQLQVDLDNLKEFTDDNLMVINGKKTQIMSFNFRKTLDFPPELKIAGAGNLEVVRHTKLLGIVVSDDLKWSLHVEFMCKKASAKIWLLRRMKILNIEVEILVDFYLKEIRSILEFGVACWNNGLTIKQSYQIERIQKICVNVILCDTEWEIPYKIGCTLLGVEPLYLRRKELCIRFIQKCSLNPMHSDLFTLSQNVNTRQEKQLYREFSARTDRFYNSPLCYLTRLLNSNPVEGCPKNK